MIYEETCSNCDGGGLFINNSDLECCIKCKGWGVLEVEVEYSVWDGNRFIDVYQTNKDAELAMVDCVNPRIEHSYIKSEWNYQWNFGRSLV